MVITDFSGTYINPENTSENDLGVIVSAGRFEQKKTAEGKSFRIFVLDIEKEGRTLEYSPPIMTGKRLQKAYGMDSIGWLGKKVSFKLEKNNKNKMEVQAYPLLDEKA